MPLLHRQASRLHRQGLWRYLARRAYKTIAELPEKQQVSVSSQLNLAASDAPRTEITQTTTSAYGGLHSMKWADAPQTVLVVTKDKDKTFGKVLGDVVSELTSRKLNVILDDSQRDILSDKYNTNVFFTDITQSTDFVPKVDFAVVLGGDGTLLKISSIFGANSVPPVLGINLGTLGFMLPIDLHEFPEILDQFLDSRTYLLLRMRLEGTFNDQTWFALNEFALHRGACRHMIIVDTFVDGGYLSDIVADGLIVSTPTGSTAYSLSAGGPLIHPSLKSLCVVPIAPRSLNIRPLIFPADATMSLKLSPSSRGTASLSVDGYDTVTLDPSQSVQIAMSKHPLPWVVPRRRDYKDNTRYLESWVKDISRMLSHNESFQQKI